MYAYFIDISQGRVETHFWCGGITLFQIVWRARQWKNFENRPTIGENRDKNKVARFLSHPVVCANISLSTTLGGGRLSFYRQFCN